MKLRKNRNRLARFSLFGALIAIVAMPVAADPAAGKIAQPQSSTTGQPPLTGGGENSASGLNALGNGPTTHDNAVSGAMDAGQTSNGTLQRSPGGDQPRVQSGSNVSPQAGGHPKKVITKTSGAQDTGNTEASSAPK